MNIKPNVSYVAKKAFFDGARFIKKGTVFEITEQNDEDDIIIGSLYENGIRCLPTLFFVSEKDFLNYFTEDNSIARGKDYEGTK